HRVFIELDPGPEWGKVEQAATQRRQSRAPEAVQSHASLDVDRGPVAVAAAPVLLGSRLRAAGARPARCAIALLRRCRSLGTFQVEDLDAPRGKPRHIAYFIEVHSAGFHPIPSVARLVVCWRRPGRWKPQRTITRLGCLARTWRGRGLVVLANASGKRRKR